MTIVRNTPQQLVAVLSAVSLLICGCGTATDDAPPKRSPSAQFTPPRASIALTIEPSEDDPSQVVVIATADNKNVWSELESGDDRKVLSLRLAGEAESAVLGRYTVDGKQLRFEPAFPLLPGQRYVARFDPEPLSAAALKSTEAIVKEHRVPKRETSGKPEVVEIYPSGSLVPANHLKFYIVFSQPMQEGKIFEHLQLENITSGEPVSDPFRLAELWSRDRKRLTLWLHPGRQKTGVNLNEEIGPVLKEGERYKLTVSADWPSEQGVPLGTAFAREFRAGPPDHKQPDMKAWFLFSPRSGTRDQLLCELSEPLDWSLLHSGIYVQDPHGKPVPGKTKTGYGELNWQFQPTGKWKPGKHRLAISSVLEDLAGNSIERPFERDLEAKPAKTVPKTVYLEFNILPPE